MYRCTVDNAITYTSEDFVLFRESPFACWMERLTLENPEHGIPADLGSVPPGDSIERQDDMADTLRAEGKDVCLVDWDADEASRRSATLEAMRRGADFIVNGQLALGSLSSAANLLMRTSGYSQLGDFLYIPCDTQARNTHPSAFRLCFLADLLHSLQGQMPPQMLIIRGGDDLVPLQTDSYIYHYRAVKQRFMESMRGFRKHRMPDPAASSHFGRWSDCAHEVLKQRMLHEDDSSDETTGEDYSEPMQQAVGTSTIGSQDPDTLGSSLPHSQAPDVITALSRSEPDAPGTQPQPGAAAGFTLAEQARMLKPGTYQPGPGVYRLGTPRQAPGSPAAHEVVTESGPGRQDESQAGLIIDSANEVSPGYMASPGAAGVSGEEQAGERSLGTQAMASPVAQQKYNRRASDAALQNLEFIGSSTTVPGFALDTAPASDLPSLTSSAPAPSLRDPRTRSGGGEVLPAKAPPPNLNGVPKDSKAGETQDPRDSREHVHAEEPVSSVVLPDAGDIATESPSSPRPAAPGTAGRPLARPDSAIDLDGAYPASPPSGLTTRGAKLPGELLLEEEVSHSFGQAAPGNAEGVSPVAAESRPSPEERPFSDSIFNNRIFTEGAPDDKKFSDSLMTSDDYDS